MDLLGVDTVSFLVHVARERAQSVADRLPHERRSKRHGEHHHYGNFGTWSATLHVPRPTQFGPATLVLSASLPRLLYGENTRPVGTLGAIEAQAVLFERAAVLGISLDPDAIRVCRVDYCATFVPFSQTKDVIGAVARTELPRRERAAMSNGVTFYARSAKETVYDKQREVTRALNRVTRRALKAVVEPADSHEFAALVKAKRRLHRGALRIECRLTGSRAIASRLKIDAARPELVLTTECADLVVGAFLRNLERRLEVLGAVEAATTLALRLGPVRGQRAFALLALADLSGSIEAAGAVLGIAPAAAHRLVSQARSVGAPAVALRGPDERSPLALRAISVERTDRFERRLLRTWQRTQATSLATHNFSLSSAA